MVESIVDIDGKIKGESESNVELADKINAESYAIATANASKEVMAMNLRTHMTFKFILA